jgi:hypothetical protein
MSGTAGISVVRGGEDVNRSFAASCPPVTAPGRHACPSVRAISGRFPALAALGQHGRHQVTQRSRQVGLADQHHMVIHPEVVDTAPRDRPVGRGKSRGPADQALPAPGIGTVSGVEHPPAHAPVGVDPGNHENHPPSVPSRPPHGRRTSQD